MIQVAHESPLTNEERNLIEEALKSCGSFTVDEDYKLAPTFHRPLGHVITTEVAILVITFLGTGAALMLKSFLEAVGSELGKKLVEHFKSKPKNKHTFVGPCNETLFILYEISEGQVALMPLMSSNTPGFHERMQIPEAIQKAAEPSSAGQNGIFWASFDEKSKLWKVESLEEGIVLEYTNEDGKRKRVM